MKNKKVKRVVFSVTDFSYHWRPNSVPVKQNLMSDLSAAQFLWMSFFFVTDTDNDKDKLIYSATIFKILISQQGLSY